MKKAYTAPTATTTKMYLRKSFMQGTTSPEIKIDSDKNKGFNEDNDRSDWLSNRKEGIWGWFE